MQLAGRTTRKTTAGVLLSSFLQTYAAGWKNKKKNNSRSASFFLSSDLCSWVEEQEEKQQQVEHTCWKLVALQGLLTETEPTQGRSAKSSS